jgi:ElaB/YqjD/DUF883 family membrane-anchored ribosome-binding protein
MKTATVFKFEPCRLTKHMTAARRSFKNTWRVAEDTIDTTKFAIRKYPFRAVGLTAGIALGAGLVTGWLAGRK